MKKIISVIFLCGFVLGLTACNSSNGKNESNSKEESKALTHDEGKKDTKQEETYTNFENVKFSEYYTGDLVEFKDLAFGNHLEYTYSDYDKVESLSKRADDWSHSNSNLAKEFIRLLDNLETQRGVTINTKYQVYENENYSYINLKSSTDIRYWDKEAVGIWYNQVNPDVEGSSGLICKLYIEDGVVKSEGTNCSVFVKENSKKFKNIKSFSDIYKPKTDGKFEKINDGSFKGLKYTNKEEIVILRYDGGYMPIGIARAFKYDGKIYIEESVFDYNKFAKLDPIF